MAIKWKNTKTNGCFVVSACWILLLTVLIVFFKEWVTTVAFIIEYGDDIISGNMEHLFSSLGGELLVGSIYAICLVIGTIWWLKKHSLSSLFQEKKKDQTKVEFILFRIVLIILGIVFLHGSWYPTISYGWYSTVSYELYEMIWDITYLGGALLWAALLYYHIILLIRKKVLGLFGKTSLIATVYRSYQDAASISNKILGRHHFVCILICCGLGIIILLNLIVIAGEGIVGLELYTIIISSILLVIVGVYFLKHSGMEDVGKLAEMVHGLDWGVPSANVEPIAESSLLYDTACELKHIQHTMEENVEIRIRSERMKVDLITNVSHDLKTPLTSIMGYTELLKKEELSPVAKDYVEIIADKQEKLKSMIQNMFELSKATSRSEQLDMQVLDMNRLIEQIMIDMGDVLDQCEFGYVKQLAEEPLIFMGDNNKMYRVVQNVLENTAKYAMPGTRVFVETALVQGKVQLQVKNTAAYEMNFTPEEIKERFTRGDKARTSEGHGLGLAIAESLVENMNGTLDVAIDGDVFKVLIAFEQVSPADNKIEDKMYS